MIAMDTSGCAQLRIIMKVSHQYVPHAYFSTSILLAMKHSIISVLWMKLKLGHCPTFLLLVVKRLPALWTLFCGEPLHCQMAWKPIFGGSLDLQWNPHINVSSASVKCDVRLTWSSLGWDLCPSLAPLQTHCTGRADKDQEATCPCQ